MSLKKILIYGSGVVGLTTAKLFLDVQLCEVTIVEDISHPKPIVLINKDTEFILSSIWNIADGYWNNFQNVTQKKCFIAYEINTIPFNATAIDPNNITHLLNTKIKSEHKSKLKFKNIVELNEEEHFDLEFHCSTSVPQKNYEKIKFGTRRTLSTQISNTSRNLKRTCVLLSLQDIWIFIFPYNETQLVLQIMTTEISDSILNKAATHIQTYFPEINNVPLDRKSYNIFPSFPWIGGSFQSMNKIFVGNSIVSYDPLCGDGLGNALRSALLATAIASSTDSDEIKKDMFEYYKQRVTLNFINHINTCLKFYSISNGWSKDRIIMENELKKLTSNPINTKHKYFLDQSTLILQ